MLKFTQQLLRPSVYVCTSQPQYINITTHAIKLSTKTFQFLLYGTYVDIIGS